jgi:hypothetical protein
MTKTKAVLILALCALVVASALAHPQRVANLGGTVIDRQGRPAPGLTVSLISAQLGRSAPRTTDGAGQFLFVNIPAGQEYYLEVYWGRELVFRTNVPLNQDTNLGVIRL